MIKLEKKEKLTELLNIKKRDVVTVVGSHGKTSFCLNLCTELKNEITFFSTTTKIYEVEEKYNFESIYYEKNDDIEKYINKIINKDYKKGVYIFGERKEKKVNSLPLVYLEKINNKCDYFILEGDGSKEKPLKGWNKTEPVYIDITTKSIGIIPINMIGKKIIEKNIHRMDYFLSLTNEKLGNNITVDTLYNIIIGKEGLFQYSKGEKILLINCVENDEDKKNVIKLYKKLIENKIEIKIYCCSLKNKIYYDIKNGEEEK